MGGRPRAPRPWRSSTAALSGGSPPPGPSDPGHSRTVGLQPRSGPLLHLLNSKRFGFKLLV